MPLVRQDLSVDPLLNRDFKICSALLPLNSNLRGEDDYQARSCVTTIRYLLLDSYYFQCWGNAKISKER